jgi:hypothetical protein
VPVSSNIPLVYRLSVKRIPRIVHTANHHRIVEIMASASTSNMVLQSQNVGKVHSTLATVFIFSLVLLAEF